MPGLAGPRVPRPNAAVPTSPSCVALGLRLSSRSYRPNRVNGKGSPGKGKTSPIPRPKNPPDGTAVSRLKASIPRPPRANRTATASLCSVLRPKGGAAGKESSDGSHPARPKQKQTVCPHQDKPQAFVDSDAPRQAVKLLKAKCTMHKA